VPKNDREIDCAVRITSRYNGAGLADFLCLTVLTLSPTRDTYIHTAIVNRAGGFFFVRRGEAVITGKWTNKTNQKVTDDKIDGSLM
jgi:hypothetical protein